MNIPCLLETEEQVCEWESAVSVLSKPRQVMHVLAFTQLSLNSSFTPQIRESSTQGFYLQVHQQNKRCGGGHAMNPLEMFMGMEQ